MILRTAIAEEIITSVKITVNDENDQRIEAMSDPKDLQIIVYPDPRLKKRSKPIEKFDAELNALATRMFDLMREAKGVGLAAPQVGVNLQLFIMNPTGKPEDDRVYINPSL